VEGLENSKWVLIDLGDILVHIFDEHMRGYYDLDGLWMDAPRVPPGDLGIVLDPQPIATPAK
jgi:ribosome-associated protein